MKLKRYFLFMAYRLRIEKPPPIWRGLIVWVGKLADPKGSLISTIGDAPCPIRFNGRIGRRGEGRDRQQRRRGRCGNGRGGQERQGSGCGKGSSAGEIRHISSSTFGVRMHPGHCFSVLKVGNFEGKSLATFPEAVLFQQLPEMFWWSQGGSNP